MNAYPRYEDTITIVSATPRQVNTKYGVKTVWDVIDERGRKLQSWDNDLGMQAANLVTSTVVVQYEEKPSSDPQFPPNLDLKMIRPQGLPGSGAVAGAPAAPAQPQTAPPTYQPVQQAPVVGLVGTSGYGPSDTDKACMRRSAAVKAAATALCSDPELDFWKLIAQVLVYIETGNDPYPSEGRPSSPEPQTRRPVHPEVPYDSDVPF